MGADQTRRQLRAAVYSRDSDLLIALLDNPDWPPDALQLIGDGLLAALHADHHAAVPAAGECAARLRQRGWDGDDTLADALDARLGTGPVPLLRPLPIDLDLLTTVLETEGSPQAPGSTRPPANGPTPTTTPTPTRTSRGGCGSRGKVPVTATATWKPSSTASRTTPSPIC